MHTVKSLNTDTSWDEQKYPSYRGARLIEVIFNRNLPLVTPLTKKKILKKTTNAINMIFY